MMDPKTLFTRYSTWVVGVLMAGAAYWLSLPPAEQAALATAAWTIEGGAVPLTLLGNLKPPVAVLLARWQLSQVAPPMGTCVPGITSVAGTPTSVLPAAWQVAHA